MVLPSKMYQGNFKAEDETPAPPAGRQQDRVQDEQAQNDQAAYR